MTSLNFAETMTVMASRAAASAEPSEALPELLLPLLTLCGGVVVALARPADRKLPLTHVGDGEVIQALQQLMDKRGDPVVEQAFGSDRPVTCADATTESRWPAYTYALIAHTPVRSVHAHPVRMAADKPAALITYATRPHHFTTELSQQIGQLAQLLGSLLSLLGSRDELKHTHTALRTCRDISQALGILMATHKITSEQAFNRLRVASQHSHVKLHDIATEVSITGRLPSSTELQCQRWNSHS